MDHSQYVMDYIKDLAAILEFTYRSPDHNNKTDPLDEVIFILLSRRTRGNASEMVFDKLKIRFPQWEQVLSAPPKKLLDIVGEAGLGSKRVEEITQILFKVNEKFGEYTLDGVKKWDSRRVFEFLTSLPGIGPKSAYCVMMYSLNREVFPVDTHVNRICQRIGIVMMGLHHKDAQTLLARAFPKSLRYSLHVNMLAHGKAICTPQNPKCNVCAISGFCNFVRTKGEEPEDPRIMDLFAGAGGMSLGFEKAGFQTYTAIESNTHASSTFLYNRSSFSASQVLSRKVQLVDPKRFSKDKIKVIVAGPPCQEFSKVKKKGVGEWGRKELYKEVLRFVKTIKPRYVVIENVPGMASHLNRSYKRRVEEGLEDLGYQVQSEMINAKDYGIPQNRIRLFFIGRKILRGSQDAAERSLTRVWKSIHSKKKDKILTFSQGISGLPRLKASEGAEFLQKRGRGGRSHYAHQMKCNGGPIFNHKARKHNPRDLEAYALLEEGENALDLHSKRPDLMPYSTENFPTKFFKIRSDKPSPTIVAHLRRDANSFVHPLDNRGITPREAARLQSFPDTYRFLGSFGIQFEQIGNAVPPLLAEVIASAILEEINRNKNTSERN